MATLFFLIFVFAVCKGISAAAHAPRRQRSRANATPQAVQRSSGPTFTPAATLATLDALQQQRDLLIEQLDLVNYALDAAPPENKRMQLLQRQAIIYSRLAACESKIGKITGL